MLNNATTNEVKECAITKNEGTKRNDTHWVKPLSWIIVLCSMTKISACMSAYKGDVAYIWIFLEPAKAATTLRVIVVAITMTKISAKWWTRTLMVRWIQLLQLASLWSSTEPVYLIYSKDKGAKDFTDLQTPHWNTSNLTESQFNSHNSRVDICNLAPAKLSRNKPTIISFKMLLYLVLRQEIDNNNTNVL